MHARLVTAVALYGTKTGALARLLEAVQHIASEGLRGRFRPYTLDQVHATVIRLDGFTDDRTGAVVNQRYLEATGTVRAMDHGRALDILAAHLTPPVTIRIGGYAPDVPAGFSSRGQHPYDRSFSVQGDALVLVGWPVAATASGVPRRPLDELRRTMNDANILHLYHGSSMDIDDDFHLVVGHHHDGAPEAETTQVVHAVRDYLAQHPVQIDVGAGQLAVIASDSPTLAPARFVGRLPVDPADVVKLYR